MRFGRDYLLGGNYESVILRHHPQGWAAGFILNTTTAPTPRANCWPTIERLLATGRCPEIRVHAVWDDAHKYNERRDMPVILREARKAIQVKAKFPAVEVQFSWFCEHAERRPVIEKVLNEIRKLPGAASLVLVNALWRGDAVDGVVNEVHGSKSRPQRGVYNFSYDGQNAFDSDIVSDLAKFSGAKTFYLWCPQDNGRKTTNDKTARPQRKAWLYPLLQESLVYLVQSHRGPVTFPRQRGGLRIWKTHADQHTIPPEPRAHNPVLIVPENVRQIELVAANGQVVDTMKNAGSFKSGGFRYYIDSSRFGFEIAERARRVCGSPTVTLRAGRTDLGTVHPAFRAGSFRDGDNG